MIKTQDKCVSIDEALEKLTFMQKSGRRMFFLSELNPEAAQQSAQRTVEQKCIAHNMEYCVECYPVVKIDFNRR